ncbi:cysteine-rich receptor-like protein kinase 2 [Zingiber officinale]|uniref:cysteine-rich receptor-like protein kinase 2 n=1 Tax=Zingiber officinale TaxID=94328 RepID=UPI001C4BCDFC|nr:cysteine-rich receptor-like protein kinase 2 [Zingiber officinale]
MTVAKHKSTTSSSSIEGRSSLPERFSQPTSGDPICIMRSALGFMVLLLWSRETVGDPQINLLQKNCNSYNAIDASAFAAAFNDTLADLRSSISDRNSFLFATSRRRSENSVYALFQCRGYLSAADCLACFSAAEGLIRSCGAAYSGNVIYDGCFLRYETDPSSDVEGMNGKLCGDRNATIGGLTAAVRALMADLNAATPRIPKFFAAAAREGVFAVAQCLETESEEGCEQCLAKAVGNVMQCLPHADGRALDVECFMRYSDESFFPADRTVDLSPYLTNSGRTKSSNKGALIGGVAGGVGGLLLLLGVISLMSIRRSRDQRSAFEGDTLGGTKLQGSYNFRYRDLKNVTNNFSEKNKLGEGGFGDVYKGQLKNGRTIAVKRLAIAETSRARTDFQSEVKLISNIHHRNLVRLIGYSSKHDDFLLVYECMANGSLDKFIFGDKRGFLNWRQRFDIIVGTARGLAYLHQEFHVRIIHRDIKCSNILLDDNFQPKVADFGLARLLPEDKSHLSTIFAGTFGYTAPEYAIHGQLSEKVDTYSYGVVVLEIISGRKCNDIKLEPATQYLLEWVWKLYERDQLLEMVDETLDPSDYSPEEVKKIINIALLCTQSTVAARPTMSEIVVLLLNQTDNALQPTRPTFIDASSRVHGEASSSAGSSSRSHATPHATSHATFSTLQFSAR